MLRNLGLLNRCKRISPRRITFCFDNTVKERCIYLILAVKNENFFKIYHYLCLLKLNDSKHV